MFTVTLIGYAPPERADGIPYIAARVEEAPSITGPWEPIETIAITPAENPAEPEAVNLTTDEATLEQGFYRVTWLDRDEGESLPSPGQRNLALLESGIRPSVASVAGLLRARTKIKGGMEQGTFNSKTRPTGVEVNALIDEAMDEVLGKVQPVETMRARTTSQAAEGYERRVRGAIRLYTGILVEMSYFPEQIKSGQSVSGTLMDLYEFRIRALIAEGKAGHVQGEGGAAEADSPADPYYTFPSDSGGLVGWQSRW